MKTRSQQPRKHVEPKAVCKISKARHTRKNVVEVSQEDALALHSPEEVTEKRWELFRKVLLVLQYGRVSTHKFLVFVPFFLFFSFFPLEDTFTARFGELCFRAELL